MLFCWVWNLTFTLISCKTGNNTGFTYNLLRGKTATAGANEGKFSAQKHLSQKAPFRKTDKHTYWPSKAKLLQSPCRFVQQHIYSSPPSLPCHSAGEDNSCRSALPNLCQGKLHQQLRVFSDRWSWTGSRLQFLCGGSFSFTYTITILDPLCDLKAKNCER